MRIQAYRVWVLSAALVAMAALAPPARADHLYRLHAAAVEQGRADWGHWGIKPDSYAGWSTHSNRLIPVYTFGLNLNAVRGEQSIYRDAERLTALYGKLPSHTLNPQAEYFDQTDIYHLQKQAVKAGKKYVFLVVFDGLDWHTTRAAAIHYSGKVSYDKGRGSGLLFQDYGGAETDFGYCVTSPHNEGTDFDVDAQTVINPGGTMRGGYDPALGGATPWAREMSLPYLISKDRARPHAYTDSAPSAVSLTTGRKTYNGAINIDPDGKQIETIAHQLQRDGFGIGVVTSVPISHATPSAAYSHNVSRDDYQDLSRDLLGLPSVSHRGKALPGVDVLISAGWGVDNDKDAKQGANFVPGNKYLASDDLRKIDQQHGGKYRVVQRAAGVEGDASLQAAAGQAADDNQRLFGYFGTRDGHLPFATADGGYNPYVVSETRRGDVPLALIVANPSQTYLEADTHENPTLAEMTNAALTVLEKKERFWLMVESGDVDWASHGNNLDNAIGAVKSGDEAFAAIVRWIETHKAWDDAAVIVTADHGHLLVLKQPEALLPSGTVNDER